jgi:hypothetical protein
MPHPLNPSFLVAELLRLVGQPNILIAFTLGHDAIVKGYA